MKFYESRIDPLTGESFFPKRKNQIFATKKNQIKYNNDKSASKKRVMKKSGTSILQNDIPVFHPHALMHPTDDGIFLGVGLGLIAGGLLTYIIMKK